MNNQLDFNKELAFRTSKSSGKGGQHVNKVETRVELLFDVNASEILNAQQKENVLEHFKNRITSEGIFLLACDTERSQMRNKTLAIKRFYSLIKQALQPKTKRILTNVPKAVHAKRLVTKKVISEKKILRKKVKLNEIREI